VKGKLEVKMKDGSSLILPIHEIETAVRPGCHYCLDLTAVYADISAGAVGSATGYTSLIIRNDVGNMFLESAAKNKKLIFGPEADVAAIQRLALLKVQKNRAGKKS
jgi:coenzyme F420 hydrogenase subunit beta